MTCCRARLESGPSPHWWWPTTTPPPEPPPGDYVWPAAPFTRWLNRPLTEPLPVLSSVSGHGSEREAEVAPRISADSVADHVAQQRAAVLAAAVELFVDRGYHEVSLADIAAAVGLARNSLYRYVPDKSHLLIEWFRQTVPRTITDWEAAVAGEDPPPVRLHRWADTYLRWARSPQHQLVAPLSEAMRSFDDTTRADLGDLHRSMLEVVARVVEEAGVSPHEVAGTVHLLSGLVLGAARAAEEGNDDPALRQRLHRAITAALS